MSRVSPRLAEVAVALPVPGTFHYLVPGDLGDRIEIGSRVLVPFGRRRVTGYVFGLTGLEERPESGPGLKEITRLLDPEPLFGPSLAALFRFAAGYYHYPLGLAAAEALPSGLMVMSHRAATLTEAGRRVLEGQELPPNEAALLARLARSPVLSRLTRDDPEKAGLVRFFESKGWITIETRLGQDRVRARMQKWLVRLPPSQAGPERIGPRETELLGLLRLQGPKSLDELRSRFPTIVPMAHRLEEKGRIRVEERVVYRDSLGRALFFDRGEPVLTAEQAEATAAVNAAVDQEKFAPFLLYGVTGSGKTEVYLSAVRHCLEKNRSVLFLVPEIALTPAVEGLLRARLDHETAVLHSALSEGERYDQWLKVRRREVRVVLGARSAVFAPLEDLGLIILDEEHDGAYKQEDKLRYQARDLAVMRASQAGCAVVLGSATPSLESFHAAVTGRYRLLTLSGRIGGGRLPEVDVVDLRLDTGRRRGALTPMLKKALGETLDQGHQALFFINRRGLAGLPLCLGCGHVLRCLNCSVTLTLHQAEAGGPEDVHLSCHYCGYRVPPPERCPECGSRLLRYMGVGTERLEKEVARTFPEAAVGRLDADTARRKGELTRILQRLRDSRLDVLVGTQMVTKGHDFPNITLVGVIDADLGLHLPDFRAGERTFQLLAQVSGRAGRGTDPGRVIVQTYSPDHYTLLRAKRHDYLGFFEQELAQRRESAYPPFSRLVLVRLQGNVEEKTAAAALQAAETGREILAEDSRKEVEILGPAPAPLSKVKGKYRFQLLIKGEKVAPLHAFLKKWLALVRPRLKGWGVALAVDVDPYQMM
ncbi:MAG: primosomal protein N' [Thermodesulfobacteriota bacterium]